MNAKNSVTILAFVAVLCFSIHLGCNSKAVDETPVDEAKAAGKTPDDYPTHPYDAFPGMDGGIELTPDEIKGRNTWLLWSGGNPAFWDYLAQHSLGLADLLKILDARHVSRNNRFNEYGLYNEPGFRESTDVEGTQKFYGLRLDIQNGQEPENPPDPAVYGYSSGIIGLRLFENPAFDEKAQQEWDANRFVTDENYYKDPSLVRPYRVGMSCGFCHVQPHPLNPPADVTEPKWENLSSTMGNQYFKVSGIFGYDMPEDSLLSQLFNSSRPGTLDTSLLATDGNNNPNTMNAVFDILSRVGISLKVKPERLTGGALNMAVLPPLTLPDGSTLTLPDGADRAAPRILAGGADSVGVRGALCRVYVNIGEFHQEWIRTHNLMIGLKKQRPFEIKTAEQNSVYWQVTLKRSINLAKFFLKATQPLHLEDAPGGEAYLTKDAALLNRGKIVFAEKCFLCHSSKQPDGFFANFPANFDRAEFDKWSNDAEYLAWARTEVVKPDFRDNNYLSTDQRYPVTLIGTNASRSFADNGKRGRVWDNFSSETFKTQSPLGEIEVHHPYTGEPRMWKPDPAKVGPGRYRPQSLISMWATAPYLHNNTVGDYPDGKDPWQSQQADVSVAGRMEVFNDSIEKLLWPEKRDGLNSIYRLTEDSSLRLPYVLLRDALRSATGYESRLILTGRPWLLPLLLAIVAIVLLVVGIPRRGGTVGRVLLVVGPVVLVLAIVLLVVGLNIYNNGITIGPIPQGTPINLLFNLNGPGHLEDAGITTLLSVLKDLKTVQKKKLPSLDHPDVPNLVPNLLKINKSPDFVLDRGHTFGAELPDDDKRALIAFLKTF
jgi:hypothetical protein